MTPRTNGSMWRGFFTLLVIVAIGVAVLLLSGCGVPGAQSGPRADGPRAELQMTNDGWQCANCNLLIAIDHNDRPLFPIEEGGK